MSTHSELHLAATALVDGRGAGTACVLTEPLNAWGGLDPATGVIVHHSHPQRDTDITGCVLVLEETRGSGTNAQVLAQTWASGHGPAAVVLARPDFVLCVGAVVGDELYGVRCPVVVVGEAEYRLLQSGSRVEVVADRGEGTVTISG
ncbi:aconitase X swivel domain-containing protein [Nocardia sp. BMG51109]|uniref:aconitase X swivel domain-containing protein n=1 Tax=Nocardia sp. BMG51109 TaxID=1056816 RepID=UPI000462FB20|nr:DUF126 domain-containing protein [Nocardia sp. BMG51109]